MMFDKLFKISEIFFNNQEVDTNGMTITFDLEKDDYVLLSKELFVKKNGTIKGFVLGEEIDLTLNGIRFLLKQK